MFTPELRSTVWNIALVLKHGFT